MTELSQTPSLNLLATCPKGIEGLLADELQALGAEPGKTTVAGVYFTADQATAYRVCLWSRLANRVILLLARESMIETAEQVRDVVARIAWRQHLAPGRTLAVDFHGRSEHIRHTRFGAQTVKDGVVDSLQLSGQERPNVDTKTPDLRLYAHLHRANLSLGIDLS
ncbi:THUMP domain-containing protein, partial [Vreelandella stevensii]